MTDKSTPSPSAPSLHARELREIADGLKPAYEHFASMERETISTIAQIVKRIGTAVEFPDDVANHAHYTRNAAYFGERATAIRTAIDALGQLAALAAPPEGWLDIDSAPKMKRLLVWNGEMTVAIFHTAWGRWQFKGVELQRPPTHWMSLPTPPRLAASRSGETETP